MKKLTIVLILIFIISIGCNQKNNKIKYRLLQIGKEKVWAEIADTQEKRIKGLMHRHYLNKNCGMLFVYEKPLELSFWMKNTHIPLSIAFINAKKEIVKIVEMEPYDGRPQHKLPSYKSDQKVQYALEMQQGWFKARKIRPKTKVIFLDFKYKTK